MNSLLSAGDTPRFFYPSSSVDFSVTFSHEVTWAVCAASLRSPASRARCRRGRPILSLSGPASGELGRWRRVQMAFSQPEILLPFSLPPSNTFVDCADFNSKAGGERGMSNGHKFAFGLQFTSVSGPASRSPVKEINQLNIDFKCRSH